MRELAESLKEAYSDAPIAPLRNTASDTSVDVAYTIQEANTSAWIASGERRLVGRKIGLTSKAVQTQLGVDQPDYGMLWADTAFVDGEVISYEHFLQPRVEAEIAFVIGRDVSGIDLTSTELIAAIEYAQIAIEIVDSRIADWDISLFDTIADNASYGGYVLGTRPVALSQLDLANCKMQMRAGEEIVSTGRGSDCLGNPLNATLWLARKMTEAGRPLSAGDVVLSGAVGPMVSAEPGQSYNAEIEGLGAVRAVFSGVEA